MNEAFEAFEELQKKLDAFFVKECFKTNKKTGKKELSPFGVKLLIYCSIMLYSENRKLKEKLRRGEE